MNLSIRQMSADSPDFFQKLDALIAWEDVSDAGVQQTVSGILQDIRARGDAALLEYTNRFDHRELASAKDFIVTAKQIESACEQVSPEFISALESAAARIRNFHSRQLQASWTYRDDQGNLLGQQVSPIGRAGVYVPGGKAAYPSSVLMNVIPAQVAGVEDIVMVTPAPGGELNPVVLAAAKVAGVTSVFSIGGAQAIAALAYGTNTVPAVDKIVGPGNIFVATAKKMLFGAVGLDMIAGPSEILVVCDGKTNPDWIALDLFSQAEHDEQAQSILISPDADFLAQVEVSMQRLLPQMERAELIRTSLEARGAFIKVDNLDQAVGIVNRISPEHLELSVEDAENWLPKIRNAGAIFLGRYTPEALGDYCAGPNHVLPTSTTARFSSPLGVYDFQKRSSIIGCSPEGAAELAAIASTMARGEGLTAHARSAEIRSED
jgi:histidinol dehydrogenase